MKKSKTKILKSDFQDIVNSQTFKSTKKLSLQNTKEHMFAGHSRKNSGDIEIISQSTSKKPKTLQK